jgi:lipoprotein-anchoring transpeptidase ErfK/SrfK
VRGRSRRAGAGVALALLGALVAAGTGEGGRGKASFPAVADVLEPTVVRAAPGRRAARVAVLSEFRRDFRPTVVLAMAARVDRSGRLWYRVRLPAPSNRLTGWVRAAAVAVEPADVRIVVRRGARLLEAYRGRRLVLRTRVAVGMPGAETPLGSFYVTARFRPTLTVLGRYALETSAYSSLSDWPGGGVIAIHGTPWPWLLGRAVSHGCIRVSNEAIVRLRRLVPLGTPVTIVR